MQESTGTDGPKNSNQSKKVDHRDQEETTHQRREREEGEMDLTVNATQIPTPFPTASPEEMSDEIGEINKTDGNGHHLSWKEQVKNKKMVTERSKE